MTDDKKEEKKEQPKEKSNDKSNENSNEEIKIKVIDLSKDDRGLVDGAPYWLYKFFGVEKVPSSERTANKLKDIWEYFYSSESNGDTLKDALLESREAFEKAFKEIRNKAIELGEPSIGQSRFDRLYQHVKLDKAVSELRKRQKAMEQPCRLWGLEGE